MRPFGELEAAIMECLWKQQEPTSVRIVLEALQPGRQLAYTTVMTVMDILHKKGWLQREKSGRAYLYRPVMSKEAYNAQAMREALSASTNRSGTLVHFSEQLSPEEVELLRAALESSSGRTS